MKRNMFKELHLKSNKTLKCHNLSIFIYVDNVLQFGLKVNSLDCFDFMLLKMIQSYLFSVICKIPNILQIFSWLKLLQAIFDTSQNSVARNFPAKTIRQLCSLEVIFLFLVVDNYLQIYTYHAAFRQSKAKSG